MEDNKSSNKNGMRNQEKVNNKMSNNYGLSVLVYFRETCVRIYSYVVSSIV